MPPLPSKTASPRKVLARRSAALGLSVLLALVLWEWASRAMGLALIFPGPLQTGERFFTILLEPSFWISVWHTFYRVVLSFAIALGICLPVGILMGRSAFAWDFMQVWQAAFRSAPVISVILLALMWFPDPGQVAVFVSFLMIFPILLSSIAQGSRTEDTALVEMGSVFGFGAFRRLVWISLPWLKPFLLSSGKAALGIAWKVVAAAEVLAQPRYGLGSMMQDGRINLETDRVFALTLAIILLSVLGDLVWGGIFRLIDALGGQGSKPATQAPLPEASPAVTMADPAPDPESETEPATVASSAGLAVTSSQAQAPVLEARSLHFAHNPASPIFTDWSCSLAPAEITILMAPSGRGKTTLSRLLMGLEQPQKGTIQRSKAIDFSVVFQEHRLLPWCSVGRNALLARVHKSSDPRLDARQGRLILQGLADILEIPGVLGERPAALSGGMRQRAALLRSLYGGHSRGPSVYYIWDEPFQSLDQDLKKRLLPRLGALLVQQGAGALIITHNPEDANLLGQPCRHLSL